MSHFVKLSALNMHRTSLVFPLPIGPDNYLLLACMPLQISITFAGVSVLRAYHVNEVTWRFDLRA
jgi:hypothetical protein